MKKEPSAPRDYKAISCPKIAKGDFGFEKGKFNAPKSLALEEVSENIYIADALNSRVQVFDKDLNFSFQIQGNHKSTLVYPWGVSINDSLVFVTSRGRNRIHIFHLDGYFITELSGPTGTEFLEPRGIAVDRDNTVYMCSAQKRVLVRLTVLPLVKVLRISNYPVDVKLHKEYFIVLEQDTTKITFFTKTDEYVRSFEMDIRDPEFLAVDHFDNLLITSRDSKFSKGNRFGHISVVSWEGELICYITGLFKNIKGIAIDKSGNIVNVCELEQMRLKIL